MYYLWLDEEPGDLVSCLILLLTKPIIYFPEPLFPCKYHALILLPWAVAEGWVRHGYRSILNMHLSCSIKKKKKKTLNIYLCHVPNIYAVDIFLKSHVAKLFVKCYFKFIVSYFK